MHTRVWGITAGLAVGLLVTGTAAAAQVTAPRLSRAAVTAPTLYVMNRGSDSVTPVSTATNKPGKPIKVGMDPSGMALTPSGKKLYVLNYTSQTVTPISTATNTAGKAIIVGHDPRAIVMDPNGKTAYVVDHNSNDVTPIAVATNKAGPRIKVGRQPIALAITPNGKTAYVVNERSATVTPINTATNKPGTPIKSVGLNPTNVAITPDGETAYVTSISTGTVIPIDTATNTAGPAITFVANGADSITISPDGSTAYVVGEPGLVPVQLPGGTQETPIQECGGGFAFAHNGKSFFTSCPDINQVLQVQLGTNAVLNRIPAGGAEPFPLALTPNGRTLYVANTDSGFRTKPSTVTPVNTATSTAGTPIKVGISPVAMVMTP